MLNTATNEITGVVHIEAHDSAIHTTKEIQWLADKMKNSILQYKHIAFADITLPHAEFVNIIDQIVLFSNVVGIRHILAHTTKFDYNPNTVDLSINKNIKGNLDYLAKNNLIFDCQVYSEQIKNILPAIISSQVTTVIDHMLLPAWDHYNDKDCNLWQKTITQLSTLSNVYLKLSGVDMFQPKSNFNSAVMYCLDKFSSKRLIYGSNYPVSFSNDYNYWYNYLATFKLSESEKECIFYNNAKKLFQFI